MVTCYQLFSGPSSARRFCSGLILKPFKLRKNIDKWQNIHKRKLLELLKEKKVSEAATYFYEEVKVPDRSIYSILLASIGRTGHTALAFKIFRDLRARDIRPNSAILTSLFNACANNDENRSFALLKARNLYEQIQIQGWRPAAVTYHSMMKAFAIQGDCDACFRLMDEMVARGHAITIDTYNHLLMGCIANKEIGFVLAVRVLRHMLWRRIRPNATTFNHLLTAAQQCGCGDDISLLNKLLNDARQSQLKDPMVTLITSGESLLDVRLKDQLVAVATVPKTSEERLLLVGGPKGILSSMSYFRVEPSAVTYSHLLKAYTNEEELMQFVRSLDRTVLDVGFWNQLLKKCIVSKLSCVDEVIKMMNESNMKKDIITYGILAMRAQTDEEIKAFIKDIEKKQYAINEVIMSTLVTNVARQHKASTLAYLLSYCELRDIHLNQKALRNIAIAMDRAHYPSQAYTINKFLKQVKTTPSNELTRSRLKQFEPLVWKKDRLRFDPDSSEAEQVAREKGTTLTEKELEALHKDEFIEARKDDKLSLMDSKKNGICGVK